MWQAMLFIKQSTVCEPVSCISHNYLGDHIQDYVMGKACGTYGREDKYIQDIGGETWKIETTCKT